MAITEQQKALSLVNLLRLSPPKAESVPAGIREAYRTLLTAYTGLTPAERDRVFCRARYEATPVDRRGLDAADPDLLVEARHGATKGQRLAAAKAIRDARLALEAAVETREHTAPVGGTI
ncbi:MAG TPA: hypothetical protein VM243_00765 [Phycisphaerae bacterium]|nr:hypothetical protein [Phycisphaerae bacterium]